MFNARTYTLEDNATSYAPDAEKPVICDRCNDALFQQDPQKTNWKAFHDLKRSPYRFTPIDYAGASCTRCWCCNTTSFGGRNLVQVQRKVTIHTH